MLSFYTLPSTVIGNPTYKTLKAAFMYYTVAKGTPLHQLMTDALILASQGCAALSAQRHISVTVCARSEVRLKLVLPGHHARHLGSHCIRRRLQRHLASSGALQRCFQSLERPNLGGLNLASPAISEMYTLKIVQGYACKTSVCKTCSKVD